MRAENDSDPDGHRDLWSLREDAFVEIDSQTSDLVVITSWGETRLSDATPHIRDLLLRMMLGPISLDNIFPDDAERAATTAFLAPLANCIIRSVGTAATGQLLLSAIPTERDSSLRDRKADVDTPMRMSRFASMRSCADELWLESPLAAHRVVLHHQFASWITSSLGSATTIATLAGALKSSEASVAQVVSYLIATRMAVVAQDDGTFAEDNDPGLSYWPFHELMFHGRTRMGRQDSPLSVASLYHDRQPIQPLFKPLPEGKRFALPARSSARSVPAELTMGQVGELLFRAARVLSVGTAVDGDTTYEISERPYPSSSGLYELELYLTAENCIGLPPGIFHYDPDQHRLTLINDSIPHVCELLDDARIAVATHTRPALLITITARIGRVARRYCGVAYATSIRHVGLLQGTLYSVAQQMGLPSAAAATGNGSVTSRALHLDWPAEVNIGEFVIEAPATATQNP